MMRKKVAIKFKEAILKYIDFVNTKNSNIGHMEETAIEVINYLCSDINVARIHSIKTVNKYEGKKFPITFKPVYGHIDTRNHEDSVFIHYWGENKKDIVKFYKDSNML
jgi:hypothetical protein